VSQGVHHEIGGDLPQPALVARHDDRGGLFERHVAPGLDDLRVATRVGGQPGQVDRLAVEGAALV